MYFEATIFMIIDSLQFLSYFLFFITLCLSFSKFNCGCPRPTGQKLNKIIISLLFISLLGLAIAAPVVGLYRDKNHVKICDGVVNRTNHNQDNIKDANIFVKLMVLLATCNERFLFIIIISGCIKFWIWENQSNISDNNVIEKIEDQPIDVSRVSNFVDERFYTFYSNYLVVGKDAKDKLFIFEAWFVIQYFIYLLSLMLEIVHLVKPFYNKDKLDNIDVAHSVLYLVFDLLAFIIPFYMGTWLNDSHHEYHKKLLDGCFGPITIDKYTFKPGYQYDRSVSETKANKGKRDAGALYIKYYNFMSAKNLAKRAEFDFVPSIFGISIPLDSQGYTFSILLSVISVIFNFAFLQ